MNLTPLLASQMKVEFCLSLNPKKAESGEKTEAHIVTKS